MASGTPLDPYSIDKSPIVSEITTLKNRDLGPNPVCDRTRTSIGIDHRHVVGAAIHG